VRPQNEIEAMRAAHMSVTHIALLELVARTPGAIAGHIYQGNGIKRLDVLDNLPTEFIRTYTMQVEALAKVQGRANRASRAHPPLPGAGGNVTHQESPPGVG
jgi:hypothetical protein